ncbi:MAG TPA: type II toxin-antitoxin system VapC family toxin [Planctomycetota bacterium]|nr:type II toxin-antitoxin system VapC family toxin [Planctomycetota bacterium]
MTALDTNILVRYITQDDPKQEALAAGLIEAPAERGERLLIQPVVLCELVWVLERFYGFRKADLLPVIENILHTVEFEIADRAAVWQAFEDYRNGLGDFADCYIGRANEAGGSDTTVTFDKGLKNNPRFTVLGT